VHQAGFVYKTNNRCSKFCEHT